MKIKNLEFVRNAMQRCNINSMNLKEKYVKKVIPAMQKKFGYPNILSVPKISKVVLNIGIGAATREKDLKKQAEQDIKLITGQKPVKRAARQSEAGFKIRKGMIIGLSVCLRNKRMWDFVSRLINIALPRTRDFRGIKQKSFDGQGNLTIGIKEHIVFPEINAEKASNIFGLEITIITTASNNDEGIALLKLLGFPIKINLK